jgi:hypothetical protein
MWDLETTIEMNEKQAAEQIARLAKMFNKKSSNNSQGKGRHKYLRKRPHPRKKGDLKYQPNRI